MSPISTIFALYNLLHFFSFRTLAEELNKNIITGKKLLKILTKSVWKAEKYANASADEYEKYCGKRSIIVHFDLMFSKVSAADLMHEGIKALKYI